MKKGFTLLVLMFMTLCLCGQTYHVGDVYTAPDGSRGIVYFLFPDGSGGWAVALNDASVACKWGEALDIPEIPNLMYGILSYQQANYDTAGYQKTAIIRAYQNNSQTYAAGKVDFVNGWVLPSPGQLSLLFIQQPYINSAITSNGGSLMSNDWYWTSSESDYQNACAVHFGGSGSNGRGDYRFNQNKSVNCRVRAVRSFFLTTETELSYQWSTGDNTPEITVTPMQTTTYTVTVTTPSGCTDTAEHTIVVNEASFEEINQTTCDSYEWNGQTYTLSGNYTVSYPRSNGCDSVVTLHLTIEQSPEVTISATSDAVCMENEVILHTVSESSSIQVPPITVGDILCTDNTTVKPADWPVTGKTAMGIVFYVDNTGEHGWAMHLHEQGTTVKWTPNGQFADIPTLTNYTIAREAILDLDGYSNTQKIRNAGNATTYPAAYAVDFENGWYLPAIGQLRLLLCEIVTLNASLQIVGGTQFPMTSVYYNLSSTEYGQEFTWGSGYSGNVISNSKNSEGTVRSVRTF